MRKLTQAGTTGASIGAIGQPKEVHHVLPLSAKPVNQVAKAAKVGSVAGQGVSKQKQKLTAPDGTVYLWDGTQKDADRIQDVHEKRDLGRVATANLKARLTPAQIVAGENVREDQYPKGIRNAAEYQQYLDANRLMVTPSGKEVTNSPGLTTTRIGNDIYEGMTDFGSQFGWLGGQLSGIAGGMAQTLPVTMGGIMQFLEPDATAEMRVKGGLEAISGPVIGKGMSLAGRAIAPQVQKLAQNPAVREMLAKSPIARRFNPNAMDAQGVPIRGTGPKPVIGEEVDMSAFNRAQAGPWQPDVPTGIPRGGDIGTSATRIHPDDAFNIEMRALKAMEKRAKESGDFASEAKIKAKIKERSDAYKASMKPKGQAETKIKLRPGFNPESPLKQPQPLPAGTARGAAIPTTRKGPLNPVESNQLPQRTPSGQLIDEAKATVEQGRANLADIAGSQGGIVRRATARVKAERAARGSSDPTVRPVMNDVGEVKLNQTSTGKQSLLTAQERQNIYNKRDVRGPDGSHGLDDFIKKTEGLTDPKLVEARELAIQVRDSSPYKGATKPKQVGKMLNQSVKTAKAKTAKAPVLTPVDGGLAPKPVAQVARGAQVKPQDVRKAQTLLQEPRKPQPVKPTPVTQAPVSAVAKPAATPPIQATSKQTVKPNGMASTITKVEDFGEEIAGARKHTAVPLGPRGAKMPVEEGPKGWRSRYTVFENASGAEKGQFSIGDVRKGKDRRGISQLATRKTFATKEEAERALPLLEVARNHSPRSQADGTFAIVRQLGDNRPVVKGGFATREEAMKYMAENPEEIINHKFQGYRKPYLTRIEREGRKVRDADVTPAKFQETFGFRGGQFGKWQSNPDGQISLNHAYDGLHDMADAIGIDPKKLTLDNDLAVAFGARGTGGFESAAAHFEPGERVINLTKMNGAGTLAHEWGHAFDHHMVEGTGKYGTTSYTGFKSDTVRPIFKKVVRAMTTNAEARPVTGGTGMMDSFQKWVNRTFDNIASSLKSDSTKWSSRGKPPASQEVLDKLEEIRKRALAGEFGEKTTFIPKGQVRGYRNTSTRALFNEVDELFRKAKGRTIYTNDPSSIGNQLRGMDVQYEAANARIAQAMAGESEVIGVRSNFLKEAVEMDTKRASKYYSTEKEMWARAFEAYVHDKMRAKGIKSDYLVHTTDNKYYRALGMGNPYPEGAEREAINKAFDELFDAMEWRSATTPEQTLKTNLGKIRAEGGAPKGRKGSKAGAFYIPDREIAEVAKYVGVKGQQGWEMVRKELLKKYRPDFVDHPSTRASFDKLGMASGAKGAVRGAVAGKQEKPSLFTEAMNAPRTLQSSADVSASGRQGLFFLISNPGKSASANMKALRAMFDSKYSESLHKTLVSAPAQNIRAKHGLYLADADGPLSAREESFMASFLKRVPGIGQVVGASERHYNTVLNQVRASVFDDFVKKNPGLPEVEYKKWATFVNAATGRGTLKGDADQLLTHLSSVFYSPRFAVSRFQTPGMIVQAMANPKSPASRKIIGESAKVIATMVGGLKLAELGGANVEWDPKHTDFLRVKVGKTAYDPMAGFSQPIKLLYRAAVGEMITSDGQKRGTNASTLAGQYVTGKLAPGPKVLYQATTGKDVMFGKPKSKEQTAWEAMTPLVAQEIERLIREGEDPIKALPIPFGIGASTQGAKTSDRYPAK